MHKSLYDILIYQLDCYTKGLEKAPLGRSQGHSMVQPII